MVIESHEFQAIYLAATAGMRPRTRPAKHLFPLLQQLHPTTLADAGCTSGCASLGYSHYGLDVGGDP
jgi:hypothetical protein